MFESMKYCQIIGIKEVCCDSFEYDIEVDTIENFYANDVLVHNCKFSAIVEGDDVCFLTRSGNTIDVPNDDLYRIFAKMGRYYDFPVVFDGEMLVVDDNNQVLDRQTGNGVVGKAVKGTMTVEEAKNVRTVLWDVVPLINFRQGWYNVEYQTRLDTLYTAHATLELSSPNLFHYISIVPTTVVENFDEVEQIFNDYIDVGYEGVIIKNMNMPWENKRSKHQIKMKSEEDLEAEVIGWIPGTGKNKGLMGALQCKSGDIEFRVGTGFSEKDREQLTEDYIVGKIITVTYNKIISDKTTGIKSLFLPRFNCVRFDKDAI